MKSNFWNYLLDKYMKGDDVAVARTIRGISDETIKIIHDEIDKVFNDKKEDLDNEQTGNDQRNDF